MSDLVLDAQQRGFRGAQTRRLLLAQPPQLRRVCVIPQANVNERLPKSIRILARRIGIVKCPGFQVKLSVEKGDLEATFRMHITKPIHIEVFQNKLVVLKYLRVTF